MTPRSSCPGGESTPLQGANLRLNYEINNVTDTALGNLARGKPSFCRSDRCLSYRPPGSLLESRGGSILARAEERRTLGFPQEDQSIGTGWRRRRPGARHRRSTGIGAAGEKAVGKLPRHVAKTWWNAAAMAADLTVVEDHRQRVGKDTDHGQHD